LGAAVAQTMQRLGYGLDGWFLIPSRGRNLLSSSPRPDRLWGPHTLLFSEYRDLLRWR